MKHATQLTSVAMLFLACSGAAGASCGDYKQTRNLYFGDLHVHTSMSHDSFSFGNLTTGADAYANGRTMLDFMAVTDHAEFLTETRLCQNTLSPGYRTEACADLRSGIIDMSELMDLCRNSNPIVDPRVCQAVAANVWSGIKGAANAAYTPCDFTTFIGYEYSLGTEGGQGVPTLHRNVIFGSQVVPDHPISHYEEPTPYELWQELEATCLPTNGCKVLAIPHNTNRSEGEAFAPEGMTAPIATMSEKYEPLVEIFQNKGSSECYPLVGNDDPDCAFEKLPLEEIIPIGGTEVPPTSFVREGLKDGLVLQEQLGVNPYHMGVIASTDMHGPPPYTTDEANYGGSLANCDDTPAERLAGSRAFHNPGGLAAVWAKENTRTAVFDALKRREVYGTSGTRMSLRFFGGWTYQASLCTTANPLPTAYQTGVAMGGELSNAPPGVPPSLLVIAEKDPVGVGVTTIQIVKGWSEGGIAQEKVYVAAQSTEPDGSSMLCTLWADPEFSPANPAFYYARVLEVPTPRWSTYDCESVDVDCGSGSIPPVYAACCNGTLPETIQERAWSSPIWYRP